MATTEMIKNAGLHSNKYKEGDEIVKSFTEPDLFIYRKRGLHSAFYEIAGIVRMFKGGSSFKKHFTNPFDGNKIAGSLAKLWKVTKNQILRLWRVKGQSTSSFGTAIHRYRELANLNQPVDEAHELLLSSIKQTRRDYMANLQLGETISKNKKSAEENYAKPTHQDIRNIMKLQDEDVIKYADKIEEEFIELYNSLGMDKYESIPEVYVTYVKRGMGGEVDKLLITDPDKKICRVIDYKVQGDLDVPDVTNELLNELELFTIKKKKCTTCGGSGDYQLTVDDQIAMDNEDNYFIPTDCVFCGGEGNIEVKKKIKRTKLDVIKIQLSYYAYCLHMAGWTVEGADVFGRDGEWKHYEVDLIPMDEMEELLEKYL